MAKKKFEVNDMVYLVSDPDQLMRQIICKLDYSVCISFLLACGTEVTEHYEHEISRERNQNILLGLEEKEVPEQ